MGANYLTQKYGVEKITKKEFECIDVQFFNSISLGQAVSTHGIQISQRWSRCWRIFLYFFYNFWTFLSICLLFPKKKPVFQVIDSKTIWKLTLNFSKNLMRLKIVPHWGKNFDGLLFGKILIFSMFFNCLKKGKQPLHLHNFKTRSQRRLLGFFINALFKNCLKKAFTPSKLQKRVSAWITWFFMNTL